MVGMAPQGTPRHQSSTQVSRLQWQQHGCIHRQQAMDCGLSASAVWRRLSTQEWTRLMPGVFAATAAPDTEAQTLMACVLWAGAGAALSHRTALKLWGEAVCVDVNELSTPHRRDSSAGLKVHQVKCLPPEHVTQREGVPVTTPLRTLMDVAPLYPKNELDALLGRFLDRGLVGYAQWVELLEDKRLKGMRGRGLLLAALQRRRRQWPTTPAERSERAVEVLSQAGAPSPEQVGAEVDVTQLRYLEQKVAVEVLDAGASPSRNRPPLPSGWRRLTLKWAVLMTHRRVCAGAIRKVLEKPECAEAMTAGVDDYAGWWAAQYYLREQRRELGLPPTQPTPNGFGRPGWGHQARSGLRAALHG